MAYIMGNTPLPKKKNKGQTRPPRAGADVNQAKFGKAKGFYDVAFNFLP